MSRALSVMLAAAFLWGCGPDVEHPPPAEAITAQGKVVGKVNGRPVTAEEVRLLSEETGVTDPKELTNRLVDRELLVDEAVSDETHPGVAQVRKRAMVRALLEDEIEEKVTVEDADPELVQQFLPLTSVELRGARGERAVALYIGPRTRKRAEAEKLTDEARKKAEEVYAWLKEEPTGERLLSFDVSQVQRPLGASIDESLTVVSPHVPRETEPEGWRRNPDLYHTLQKMEVGEVSELLPLGPGFVMLLRKEPVEPESDISDAEVKRAAREKARDVARAQRLKEFVGELREDADIEKYPALIEQQRKQNL